MKTVEDPYLTTDQAAQRVGIDRATILRLVRTGELAGKYFGSHVRTRESWLLDWLCRPSNQVAYTTTSEVRGRIEDYEARVRDALRAGACALEQIPDAHFSLHGRFDGSSGYEPGLAAESGRIILGIEFLTVEGVAHLAAVSRAVVLSWIRRGELQARMVGKNWLVARLWFEEFYHTPDSGPVDHQDENDQARRARLTLVREHNERERAQAKAAAKKKVSSGKSEEPATNMQGTAPRRKRGRPRKVRPDDKTS